MGREIRIVTRNWRHPVDINGKYIPISLSKMPKREKRGYEYFMMYENETAGTPLSPVFSNKMFLEKWLIKNNIPQEEEINPAHAKRVKKEKYIKVKAAMKKTGEAAKKIIPKSKKSKAAPATFSIKIKKIKDYDLATKTVLLAKKEGFFKRFINKLKFWS